MEKNETLDPALKGCLSRDNVVSKLPRIALEMQRRFGAIAYLVNEPETTVVWGSPEVLSEASAQAAKATGWIAACCDNALLASLENDGAFIPKHGQTPILAFKALVLALRAGASQASASGSAIVAEQALRALKLSPSEDLEEFIAKWMASLKSLQSFGLDLITEKAAINALLHALRTDRELYVRVMDAAGATGYTTIQSVISAARVKRNILKSAAAQAEVATPAVDIPKTELAAAVTRKEGFKAEPKARDKGNFCTYCQSKTQKLLHHKTFDGKGNPVCRRMMQDMLSEEMQNKMKSLASSVTYPKQGQDAYPYISASYTTHTAKVPKNTLIADSGATLNIMNDRKWFGSLDKAPAKSVIGLGGTVTLEQSGDTIFGKAYLGEALPLSLVSTNEIHGLSKVKQGVSIDYNKKLNSFEIDTDGHHIVFEPSEALNAPHCEMEPTPPSHFGYGVNNKLHTAATALNAIKQNPTAKEKRIAEEVRKLHKALNHPSDTTLERSLKLGAISTTVSYRDVQLCRQVLGPCPSCQAGKETLEARGGQYEPAELPGEHIRCDIVHLRGATGVKKPHLLAVDERTGAPFVLKIKSNNQHYTGDALTEVIEQLVGYFQARHNDVRRMYFDADPVVTSIESRINAKGIVLKQWPTGQHEPVAERMMRTITDDMRSVLAALPYQLPEIATSHLAADCAMTRRVLSNSHCGADSPYRFLEGTEPYEHVFNIPFGSLVMTANHTRDPTKPLNPRSEHGIVVERHPDVAHKCSVYLIHSGEVVIRPIKVEDLIPTPYPKEIITVINEKVKLPGIDKIFINEPPLAHTVEEQPRQEEHGTLINVNTQVQRDVAAIRTSRYNRATRKDPTGAVDTAQISEIAQEDLAGKADTTQASEIAQQSNMAQKKVRYSEMDDRPYAKAYQTSARDRNARQTQSKNTEDPEIHKDVRADGGNTPTPLDSLLAAVLWQEHKQEEQDPRQQQLIAYMAALHQEGVREYTMNELIALGTEGEQALIKEVRNIVDSGAWTPVHGNKLTDMQRKESITSFVFGKRKLNNSVKARLVANGKQLAKREEYQNLFSPTSNPMTTMAHLSVASYEKRPIVFSADFPAAYLKVRRDKYSMPKEHTRLTGSLLRIVLKAEPSYSKFVTPQGALYLEIVHSIYGLTESAALWYRELRDLLLAEGFVQCVEVDPCLFVHPENGNIVNIHVDDCLASCTTMAKAKELQAFFSKHKCTIHVDKFLFLGMDVERTNQGILVGMQTLIADKLKQWEVTGKEQYPHNTLLTGEDNTHPISNVLREEYVSKVMSLLYCGLRARFDLLFTLSVLSQHCAQPTLKNWADLSHLLKYINSTKNAQMLLNPSSLHLNVYADSSYMSHADKKGHTGVLVTLGTMGPVISAKSSKQRMQASSSTEGEIIAVYEALPQLRLATALLHALGHPSVPILHQDNLSAIHMLESGKGSSSTTKHFGMRLNVINELIKADEVRTQHTPDTQMPADLLTKPIASKKFTTNIDVLMGKPIRYNGSFASSNGITREARHH